MARKIIMVLFMLFALTACGDKETVNTPSGNDRETVQSPEIIDTVADRETGGNNDAQSNGDDVSTISYPEETDIAGLNQSIAVSNIRFGIWVDDMNREFPALLWDEPADTSSISYYRVSFYDGNGWIEDARLSTERDLSAYFIVGMLDYWTRDIMRSGEYQVRIISVGKDGVENSPAVISGNTLTLTRDSYVVPVTSMQPDDVQGQVRITGEFNVGTQYIVVIDNTHFTYIDAWSSTEITWMIPYGDSVSVRSFEPVITNGNAYVTVSAMQQTQSDSGTIEPTTPDIPTATQQPTQTAEIPNNGTPPNITATMERHAWDNRYFYVTTDDYIVWAHTNNESRQHIPYHTEYTVVSFDENGRKVAVFMKYIFPNESDAVAWANERGYEQIGNVVYCPYNLYDIEFGGFWDRDSCISFAQNDDHYISMP